MISLRTKEGEKFYKMEMKKKDKSICPFCEEREILTKYKYWFITPNRYPYDLVFSKSHILVCRRHVEREEDLFVTELEEFNKIKRELLKGADYDQLIENASPRRSIRFHYHVHLCSFEKVTQKIPEEELKKIEEEASQPTIEFRAEIKKMTERALKTGKAYMINGKVVDNIFDKEIK